MSCCEGPFKSKKVRIYVDNKLISVAELTNIEYYRKLGVESKYGMVGIHSDRRHAKGKKSGRFTIRRWYKTGTNTSLFYQLHENDTLFDIEQYLGQVFSTGDFIGIKLLNCISYNNKLVNGTPNDIIGEEISGEFTSWEKIVYSPITPEVDDKMMAVGWTDTLGTAANPAFHIIEGYSAGIFSPDDPDVKIRVPYNCTLKNLYVFLRDAGGDYDAGNSVNITVVVNGVDTALSVTLTHPNTTGENTTNEISVSAGDTVCIKTYRVDCLPHINWAFEIDPV